MKVISFEFSRAQTFSSPGRAAFCLIDFNGFTARSCVLNMFSVRWGMRRKGEAQESMKNKGNNVITSELSLRQTANRTTVV